MSGGGEPGHVGAGLGGDGLCSGGADAGDRSDQVTESAKGFDDHLDPFAELLDGSGVFVDQAQVHPDQERVVIGEPPSQRSTSWCVLARNRFWARWANTRGSRSPSARLGTSPGRGHRGQLDAGVLGQLLQSLHFDILVNNAGAAHPGSFETLTDEACRELLRGAGVPGARQGRPSHGRTATARAPTTTAVPRRWPRWPARSPGRAGSAGLDSPGVGQRVGPARTRADPAPDGGLRQA